MILNLPVEDLLVSYLVVTLGQADGRLSCNIKPNFRQDASSAAQGSSGIILNLESVQGSDGAYQLRLYASSDASASQPPPAGSTSTSDSLGFMPAAVDDCGMHDASMSSFFLPEHFSAFSSHSTSSDESCASSSPLPTSSHGFPTPSSSAEYELELCGEPSSFDYDFMSTDWDAEKHLEVPRIAHNDSGALLTTIAPEQTLSPLCFIYDELQPTSTDVSALPTRANTPSPLSSSCALTTFLPTPPPSDFESDATNNSERSGDSKTRRAAQYPCLSPGCDRVLTSLYTRQVHMGTHRPKVRKTFLCTFGCGEAFTRQHDRQRHEVALHEKQCQHVCARCRRFFSSEKMLERHVCRRLRHPTGTEDGAIQWAPIADK
ncbi:hypothetical protein FB45DRAFT_842207 [Roridomyces roridus]|uniref:C2H2-type domain-containing protein n=1 Tax=Roridomyces roridus TaxID=1738132 RepID=A0AAD7FF67_9AGAR|nr:hypothetical protein FB45DRAFT_842207 [Roridomyces roridus]